MLIKRSNSTNKNSLKLKIEEEKIIKSNFYNKNSTESKLVE